MMKIVVCLFVLTIVVLCVHAQPSNRHKRGFRLGAADRFSHGFGKRTDTEDILQRKDANLMTLDEMSSMLQKSPKLAYAFVQKFLDKNGDGMVSREELFPTVEE